MGFDCISTLSLLEHVNLYIEFLYGILLTDLFYTCFRYVS